MVVSVSGGVVFGTVLGGAVLGPVVEVVSVPVSGGWMVSVSEVVSGAVK